MELAELYKAELNDKNLSAIFKGCDDFKRRELAPGGLFLYAIDGLVASSDIAQFILRPMAEGLLQGSMEEHYRQALDGKLYNAVAQPAQDLKTAAEFLVYGFTILLFSNVGAIAFETKSSVKRGPAPPTVENTVKGAKDAFTETVRYNTALLRRHLRTPGLRLETVKVGHRSLTMVTICSVEGLTDPEMVARVRARVSSIDIDGLIDPAAVEEYLTGSR